jgi:hypothetical protein
MENRKGGKVCLIGKFLSLLSKRFKQQGIIGSRRFFLSLGFSVLSFLGLLPTEWVKLTVFTLRALVL